MDNSLDATTTGLATTIEDTSILISGKEGNIRYFGANPNNYIYFNCNDYSAQNDSTCEKWRIIGIVDGKVKLIKENTIGKLAWDYYENQDDGLTTNSNNWETSSLKEFLNGVYYDRSGASSIYEYYSYNKKQDIDVVTELNLEEIGIKDNTRNLISESTWYLGSYEKADGLYPSDLYNFERTNIVDTSDIQGTIRSGNAFTINAKIGLMNASDYGYATSGITYSSIGLSSLSSYEQNNWIHRGSEWVLTPKSTNAVLIGSSSGSVSSGSASYDYDVRPVVYLDSTVYIVSGEGAINNPYIIGMN